MRLMQISSSEWRDLKASIEAGSTPAGVFLAHGPSEEIVVQAQAILEDASHREYPLRYFLCSGSNVFRVPCFLPFPGKRSTPEPLALDIMRLFQARQNLGELVVHNTMTTVLKELEQTVRREPQDPRLILLEYLTPPAEFDLAFTLLLLKSVLPQYISLIILVHQQSTTVHAPQRCSSTVESMLSLLYMSGGRLRQDDWHNLQFPEQSQCNHFIASRQAGSDVWVCYANRQVADMAESIFQSMEQGRRHELARSSLQILPHYTGYPLLAIASETHDLKAMLSVYSQGALETAFSQPEGVVRYFGRLQQITRTADDPAMASKAHILFLAAEVLLSKAHAVKVYKRLRGALPVNIEKKTENLFWSLLGQRLVSSKSPEDWAYAAECFRLCRQSVKNMASASQDVVQLSLVAIANGEALIASKLQQGEKARELEEFALAQLQGRPGSFTSQAHVRINLGDVFLRLLGDVEAALTQYGEALLTISEATKKLKHRLTPEEARPYKQKASLKLGNALLQVGRYEEAIEILEYLLGYLEKAPGLNRVGEAHAAEVLKTRLALAQAYLKAGQQRRAALCYWRILRHPQWLDPVDLKEAAAKLRDCHPALQERLQVHMERVISRQEAIRADTMKIEEVLTSMQMARVVGLEQFLHAPPPMEALVNVETPGLMLD